MKNRLMFKLISYAIIGGILYWVGNLVYERYEYVTDRRAWLEQGRNMACTEVDRERMLASVHSALFDPIRERAAARQLEVRFAELRLEMTDSEKPRLIGEPFGLPICTEQHFPWKPSKGSPSTLHCSMPAYLSCSVKVMVHVPVGIGREADTAARYLPLRSYAGIRAGSIEGREYDVFEAHVQLNKRVPRYAQSRMYLVTQRENTALPELSHQFSGGLDGVLENWLQFHENKEQIARSYMIANDIGGAVTGGGYAGSINKLRGEQIQP